MKIRVVALMALSFFIGALVMSIPPVSNTVTNIFNYLLNGDDALELRNGGIRIDWSDAKKLITEGQVRSMVLPHSGRITMVLHNGLRFQAHEPYSGAASQALRNAPNRRWISLVVE